MSGRRWKAIGLVEVAWKRLDPPTRDTLAAALGLKAPTNLSKLNTGDLWMTDAYAARIASVVPGLTVADLGAPEEVVAELDPLVLDRLEELASGLAEAVREQARTNDRIRRLQARVRTLEARPAPAADPPKDQAQP